MEERLSQLCQSYLAEFLTLPAYSTLRKSGYGPGYTQVDAFTLYAIIRELSPPRYIEVGSGLSTHYCDLARQRNREVGGDTKMICVEPFPSKRLSENSAVELIKAEVQDVPLDVFQQLRDGDVLFIDSSHVVRLDGDVPYLFLEVLPVLAPGVHIHIHDVPFPFNIPYPPGLWTMLDHPGSQPWPMYWNEAMLVQAFLALNSSFEITLSCPMIRYFDEKFIRGALPFFKSVEEEATDVFSSIWLKRVK
jgi:hypothetical protein